MLVLVNSDAHSVRNLELMRFGIATARRAWLTPEQVANTRPWAELASAAQAQPRGRMSSGLPGGRARRRAVRGRGRAARRRPSGCWRATPGARRAAIVMSAIVFAGSAQFAAISISAPAAASVRRSARPR